jgi:hypothetical protein
LKGPFFVFAILSMLGCGPQIEAVDGPLTLMDAISVTASGPLSASSLSFHASGGLSGPDRTAVVNVDLAQLALRLDVEDAHSALRFLDLPLGDLTISPDALPPVGLDLVDLRLGVETDAPLAVVGKSAEELWLASKMGLRLTWSLKLPSGDRYALGPVHLTGIDMAVRVHRMGEGYVMTMHASCDAVCWSLPKLLTVGDLQVDLEAPVTVTPIDRGPINLPPAGAGPATIVN